MRGLDHSSDGREVSGYVGMIFIIRGPRKKQLSQQQGEGLSNNHHKDAVKRML